MALSRAHDVLTEERWAGAELRGLALVAAEPYSGGGRSPFVIEGPPVNVPPRVAIALALAFHELATNAAKYGALSRETGRVHIAWRSAPAGSGQLLEVEWRETGGPPVAPPARQGFGTRLIQRSLAAEMGGRAELDFHPEGLVCRLTAHVEHEATGAAAPAGPVWTCLPSDLRQA
jgi:two-component sensor histidine kinase